MLGSQLRLGKAARIFIQTLNRDPDHGAARIPKLTWDKQAASVAAYRVLTEIGKLLSENRRQFSVRLAPVEQDYVAILKVRQGTVTLDVSVSCHEYVVNASDHPAKGFALLDAQNVVVYLQAAGK